MPNGSRRRLRRNRGGVNWKSLLSKGHNLLKQHRVISKTLNRLGYSRAAKAAEALGYGRRYRRRRYRGGNIFKKIWSGVKTAANKVADAAKKVGKFIADNKLVSKGLSMIPDARAQTAARVASTIGLGRKRRNRTRRLGGSKMKGGAIVNPHVLIY